MSTFSTCTSSTRPASPADGDVLFETDSKNVILWDGASWRRYNSDGIAVPAVSNTYSLDFDGTNDYLSISGSSDLSISGDLTISLWFKADSFSSFEYIFRLTSNEATGTDRMLGISSSKLSGNTYGSGYATLGNTTLSTGTWYNAAIVYSGGSFILYLNGSADSSSITATMNTVTYSETTIGKSYSPSNQHFDGLIDEVSVFDSALDVNNINAVCNGGLPIDLRTDAGDYNSSSNLVGWWRMGDANSGTGNVTDSSENSNTATNNGATYVSGSGNTP